MPFLNTIATGPVQSYSLLIGPSGAVVSGGTKTYSDNLMYTMHTFTTSGSLVVSSWPSGKTYDILLVGGGAGGGGAAKGLGATNAGGGGGAGGVVYQTGLTNLSVTTFAVTVGSNGGSDGAGTPSSFPGATTAYGGAGSPAGSGSGGGGQ
jgi:hypothetical protein